jgi:hypothetical protein
MADKPVADWFAYVKDIVITSFIRWPKYCENKDIIMDLAKACIFMKRTNSVNKPIPAFAKLSSTTSWKTLSDMTRMVSIKKNETLFIRVPIIKGEFVDRLEGVKTKEIELRIKSEPGVKRPRVNLSKALVFNLSDTDDEYIPALSKKKSDKKERKSSIGIKQEESSDSKPLSNIKFSASGGGGSKNCFKLEGVINLISSDDDTDDNLPARQPARHLTSYQPARQLTSYQPARQLTPGPAPGSTPRPALSSSQPSSQAQQLLRPRQTAPLENKTIIIEPIIVDATGSPPSSPLALSFPELPTRAR